MNRLLAIDVTAKGFAYALLDGSSRLIDWGTTYAPGKTPQAFIFAFTSLLDRYQPSFLACEEVTAKGSRRQGRAVLVLRRVERWQRSGL